jgi:hypothetical protein
MLFIHEKHGAASGRGLLIVHSSRLRQQGRRSDRTTWLHSYLTKTAVFDTC